MIVMIAGLYALFCCGLSYLLLDQLIGVSASQRKQFRTRVAELESAPGISIERVRRFSHIGFIDRFLHSKQWVYKLDLLLEIAGWKISANVFILLALLGVGILYYYLILQKMHPFFAVIVASAALVTAPAAILKYKRMKYIDLFTSHFPKALQVIRGALAAGHGLPISFERAAQDAPFPVNVEFKRMMKQMQLGRSLTGALLDFKKRIPTSDIEMFVVAITVQQESGGNLVELVRNLEDTINTRVLMRRELRVLTAQARLSGWIIFMTPIFLAIALQFINPAYLALLFDTRSGRQLLIFTIVWQMIGLVAIRKIVNIRIVA